MEQNEKDRQLMRAVYRSDKTKDMKKGNVKAIIWSVALCASDTWIYKNQDIRRLEAFEMWVWKMIEKSAEET